MKSLYFHIPQAEYSLSQTNACIFMIDWLIYNTDFCYLFLLTSGAHVRREIVRALGRISMWLLISY